MTEQFTQRGVDRLDHQEAEPAAGRPTHLDGLIQHAIEGVLQLALCGDGQRGALESGQALAEGLE